MSDQATAAQSVVAPQPAVVAAAPVRGAPLPDTSTIQRALAKAEAAAGAATEAAPVVAPAAPAAPEVIAKPPDKTGLKKLPPREPIKPKGPREAMLARITAKEERAIAQTQAQKYEAELQKAREEGSTARAKLDKINAAFEQGDVDTVLAAVGFENFEAAQKRWLENRGAVPKTDPRVSELEKQLKETHEKLTAREQREAEARQAQEIAAEQQALFTGVQQQLKESGYEHLPELSEKPYFVNAVLQSMYQNPQLDDEEHYSQAFEAYQTVYNDLHGIFGKQAAPEPVAATPKRTASVASGLPRTGTAEAAAPAPLMPDTRIPGAMNLEKPPTPRSLKELNDSRKASIAALLAKLPQ